jgi:hypothetical protein
MSKRTLENHCGASRITSASRASTTSLWGLPSKILEPIWPTSFHMADDAVR